MVLTCRADRLTIPALPLPSCACGDGAPSGGLEAQSASRRERRWAAAAAAAAVLAAVAVIGRRARGGGAGAGRKGGPLGGHGTELCPSDSGKT